MIRINGFDNKEMDRIENELMDAYFSQDEIDDVDEFVKKNAPKQYLDFLKAYKAARERMKKEGKIA